MDFVAKLRLTLWLLVLGLWGLIVYQLLGDDAESARMRWIPNSLVSAPAAPASRNWPFPKPPSSSPRVRPPATRPKPGPGPAPPPAASSGGRLAPPPRLPAPRPAPPRAPPRAQVPHGHEEETLEELPAAPPGFYRSATPHFAVFAEGEQAPQAFLRTLESLHSNIMLDLAAFSPWARAEKVSVFLFRSQDTYRRVTGRPAWSGGASSVSKRKIYLYESEDLVGILAHELCHIYFDGFFLGGRPNPLWLSEGLATLVQVERGLTAPNWLPENLETLQKGGGFPLAELMAVESTSSASDDNVRLWYTQSYSVVRFLLRSQWRSAFYRFSSLLREGFGVTQALAQAYGAPFTRVKALEYAWRYDLETSRISSLRSRRP